MGFKGKKKRDNEELNNGETSNDNNNAKPSTSTFKKEQILPSMIKNKEKRSEIHSKLKHEKKLEKRRKLKDRAAADKRALELGEELPARQVPRTSENTREADETVCKPDDETESTKLVPLSAHGMLSPKERTSFFLEKYKPIANQALNYYNSKQNTNMKLSEVCVAFENDKLVHINFTATSDFDSENLFFAELKISFDDNDDALLGVKGNPLGKRCCLCTGELIHPGPMDGYRIISGDHFKGYRFWDYRPSAHDDSIMSSTLSDDDWHLFHDCATKALEYFNFQQGCEFRDMKVVAGAHQIDKIYEVERKIHVNFMAKLRSSKERELFFAELIVPMFEGKFSWENHKADFIQVKGCCNLKQVNSGNPFGRVCGLCLGRVKHPGPTYGYRAEAGDQFKDAEFWNIGLGVF